MILIWILIAYKADTFITKNKTYLKKYKKLLRTVLTVHKNIAIFLNKFFFPGVCNSTHTLFKRNYSNLQTSSKLKITNGYIKLDNKQTSLAMGRLIPGRSGRQNKTSLTTDLEVSFKYGKDPITKIKS